MNNILKKNDCQLQKVKKSKKTDVSLNLLRLSYNGRNFLKKYRKKLEITQNIRQGCNTNFFTFTNILNAKKPRQRLSSLLGYSTKILSSQSQYLTNFINSPVYV